MKKNDEFYMKEALKQAKIAQKNDEVPIGAVIVKDGLIIARGYNQKEKKKDVTKHAEMIAIQRASKKMDNWRLNNCTLYVTLKPCNMCSGAINQSRISRVVIGTEYKSLGAKESHNIGNCEFDEKIEIKIGVMQTECEKILKEFFKNKR